MDVVKLKLVFSGKSSKNPAAHLCSRKLTNSTWSTARPGMCSVVILCIKFVTAVFIVLYLLV